MMQFMRVEFAIVKLSEMRDVISFATAVSVLLFEWKHNETIFELFL